jgi:hypothetical protein
MQTWFNLKEKTEAEFIGLHSEYPSKEHVTSGLHFFTGTAHASSPPAQTCFAVEIVRHTYHDLFFEVFQ